MLGDTPYQQLPEARKQQTYDNLRALRAQMFGAGFPLVRDDEVRGVRVSALLITGRQARPSYYALTDRLQDLLPDVERIEIPAASHLIHDENASAVNDALLRFLGQRSSPTQPPAI